MPSGITGPLADARGSVVLVGEAMTAGARGSDSLIAATTRAAAQRKSTRRWLGPS